jgi:hypothetical protein
MAPDWVFEIAVVVMGCLGCWQFHQAVKKWAVFISHRTWPTAIAKLRGGSRVAYTESRSLIDNPNDIIDRSYYHSVDAGPFFSFTTTRYYYPQLRFTYNHQGTEVATDNLAPHNRHAFYFGHESVAAIVDQYSKLRTFPIRYYPTRPGHVFIGYRHFPWVWTPIQTLLGLFLLLNFSITVETVLTHLGIEEPRIADRVISVYIIPLLALGYAIARILAARAPRQAT